jgi:hypothetical protein
MRKIALILGKQGSGKTTTVCKPIERKMWHWNILYKCHLFPGKIYVSHNRYNHIAIDPVKGRLVFISGIDRKRKATDLNSLPLGAHIIEFPHSGYIPADAHSLFAREGYDARIFVIQLPESLWRSIGGKTGAMTSPDYFMTTGRRELQRSECDYQADLERIHSDVENSNIPFQYYEDAQELIRDVRRFIFKRSH